MKYGCIGEKLGHSFSKEIHHCFAAYPYELREIPPNNLDAFMKSHDFSGINVTIPYKQAVMPYLDNISSQALDIGAVNTIVQRDGQLWGYNTDFDGMKALLAHIGIIPKDKKVLILGSGGTSHTARTLMKDMGAKEILIVSRSGENGITYKEATEQHRDAQLIINTTPCGMSPNIWDCPIDLTNFHALEGVADAIYNPLRPRLIQQALSLGIPASGGLYMLVAQAVCAGEHFTSGAFPPEIIDTVYTKIKAAKENIVLTGMPGAGKTTIGKNLAAALHRPFFDTDEEIQKHFAKAPAEIISEEGNEAFRQKETQVIQNSLAGKNGCIIATGGGCILKQENIDALKMNGKILFLDRPPELLTPTEDRPLSSNRKDLFQRYKERYQTYIETADKIIKNQGDMEKTCKEILGEYEL